VKDILERVQSYVESRRDELSATGSMEYLPDKHYIDLMYNLQSAIDGNCIQDIAATFGKQQQGDPKSDPFF
jgi:hypothetical protein